PLYAPPLVYRLGPLSTCSFLSAPTARPGHALAATRPPDRSRGGAVILADSGSTSPLAPASLRNFLWRPPFMPGKAARLLVPSVSGGQTPPWARTSKDSSSDFRCSITCGSRIGPPGPPATVVSSSDCVPCTQKPDLRSTSTPAKISSTATAAAKAVISFALSSYLGISLSAKA